MRPPLRGIIAAIPTPFGGDEELVLDRLEENLKKWNETPLAGYTVLGTTGEFVSLTLDEKKRFLAKVREHVPETRIFLAGTGAESTRETIELTRWAGGIGCDYAIVITPHYNRRSMPAPALSDHYHRVADESSVPVVLYHIPVCTGLSLDPETVARIAEHPNVAGIKDSSGDLAALQEIRRLSRPDFAVLTGSVQILLAALAVGASGAILADATVAWKLASDLEKAVASSDLARAREIQARLVPLNRVLVGRYGIPGVKALLDEIGFYGGPPRRPLKPVSSSAVQELASALEEALSEEVPS